MVAIGDRALAKQMPLSRPPQLGAEDRLKVINFELHVKVIISYCTSQVLEA